MSSTSEALVWFGVADAIPKPGTTTLGNAMGAYVGVAGLARTKDDFRALVTGSLDQLGFSLFELDDVFSIPRGMSAESVEPELAKRVAQLTESNPFVFGSFHAYHTNRRDASQ